MIARNVERRRQLQDAAIRVLANAGARGLTYRAVDAEAGLATGTASNYFPSRDELVAQVFERISERLAPDPATVDELARRPPSRSLFADYVRDIVARLTADRETTLALFELRLEATRHAGVAEQVRRWLEQTFASDVAFNAGAGLPGGRAEIALFHYAIDGLLLDRLTVPIDPGTPTDSIVADLVDRLLARAD